MLLKFEKGTEPKIIIDKENFKIRILGVSYPEDAVIVFSPLLDWLDSLDAHSKEKIHCEIFIIFLNSVSNKMIYELLIKLRAFYLNGRPIEVLWKYDEEDEDVQELGDEFAENLNIPIKVIAADINELVDEKVLDRV